MADWPVEVIPNPIDYKIWSPVDKKISRDLLGISSEAGPVILFGALGLGNDSRKGFDLFESAIPLIQQRIPNAQIVVLGELPKNSEVLEGYGVKFLGLLMDDTTLRMVYSAADVFVITSRQDNLPNTGLESQACGTPVVAFDVGGLSDIVIHLETGYLAKPFAIPDLVNGIHWACRQSPSSKLRERSVSHVRENFSEARAAKKYLQIYESLIIEGPKNNQ
jgi:glycosyltransferase involved in cell wall biosynthesis